jgi:hypothetical protein
MLIFNDNMFYKHHTNKSQEIHQSELEQRPFLYTVEIVVSFDVRSLHI